MLERTRKEMIAEALLDVLHAGGEREIVDTWNEYQTANNYEARLYNMSELDELVTGTATEILNQLDDDFDINDPYFVFTIYGVESVRDVESHIYIDELVNAIYRTGCDYGFTEAAELLQRFYEEDRTAEEIAEAVGFYDPFNGVTEEENCEAHKYLFSTGEYDKAISSLLELAEECEKDENEDAADNFRELAEEVEELKSQYGM